MQRSPSLNISFSIAPVGQNGKQERSPGSHPALNRGEKAVMNENRFRLGQRKPRPERSFSGFAPLTSTFYVDTNLFNIAKKHEHLTLNIAANGNVIYGWENDGSGMTDFETNWILYDSIGNPLTPLTVQTHRSLLGAIGTYDSTTKRHLSFFRSITRRLDPTPGGVSMQ